MKPLRRHQLVWLDEFAWYRVLASASSPHDPSQTLQASQTSKNETEDCLAHWAQQRWPLVVTRQPDNTASAPADGVLALGLPAPARWGRQAISVSSSLSGVALQGEFPSAVELGPLLPAATQAGWGPLCERLAQLGLLAQVYGSYGWQQLTGMNYVHAGSDIDLLIGVSTAAQADQVGALLRAAELGPVRLDGELAFEDGASVAWREWLQFRSGQADRILVKRLAGATIEDAETWGATA
jgi:phosphoribosyl-dephospho-CoA transferase